MSDKIEASKYFFLIFSVVLLFIFSFLLLTSKPNLETQESVGVDGDMQNQQSADEELSEIFNKDFEFEESDRFSANDPFKEVCSSGETDSASITSNVVCLE